MPDSPRWIDFAENRFTTASPTELLEAIPADIRPEEHNAFMQLHAAEVYNGEITVEGKTIRLFGHVETGLSDVFFGWYVEKNAAFPQIVVVKVIRSNLINDRVSVIRHFIEKVFLEKAEKNETLYWPQLIAEGKITHPREGKPTDCSVLECIPGHRLSVVIREFPEVAKDPAFCAATGMQVASALELVHDLGYEYRDTKPDNIIVTHLAPNGFVKLIDANLIKEEILLNLILRWEQLHIWLRNDSSGKGKDQNKVIFMN